MMCYVTCSDGERRILCAWENESLSTGKQQVVWCDSLLQKHLLYSNKSNNTDAQSTYSAAGWTCINMQ